VIRPASSPAQFFLENFFGVIIRTVAEGREVRVR
jgi:hypothetical protein